MAGLRPGVQVRRVLTFLAARDMLIPDTGRQAEPRQHAVDRLLASLPGQIGREASTWVTVVRGHGRIPHPALAYKTIRNYLAYLMPVLTGWASQYTSLREVTRHDILDAIDARYGPVIQHRIVALRSLFRALRQERVIFRDPTRGISLPALARLPQPLPADHVAGLLDRADGPAARLAVALVAIHAVPVADLIHLQAGERRGRSPARSVTAARRRSRWLRASSTSPVTPLIATAAVMITSASSASRSSRVRQTPFLPFSPCMPMNASATSPTSSVSFSSRTSAGTSP